jgi:DNA-binding response OmpR family regulator
MSKNVKILLVDGCDQVMNRSPKILIVEDEMPLAMLMINVLTMVGCDVEAVHTGKKALEKAAQTKFDLITLDISLPDADGFLLCKELKERHISRHTPVIFISASPHDEDRKQSLKLGAVDYIEKPFNAGNFVSRLLSHIKKIPLADSPFEEEFP